MVRSDIPSSIASSPSDTRAELEAGRSGVRHYGPEGQTTPEDLVDTPVVRVFVESWSPPPQMWIFGAVDFTAALAKVAKVLGYRVTVCDAREIFATRRRFPMADEVRVTWPGPMFDDRGATLGPRDAVCILTHDPKFDVPAVQGALDTAVGYIGVMGSRTTHAKRMERLAEVGVDDPADIARLMSPIGLDIGARTPEETAISICGEIIANRTGRHPPASATAKAPSTPERRSASVRAWVGEDDVARVAPGEERDLDFAAALARVHHRIADAEEHHHVTRVVHQVARFGGGALDRSSKR